MRKQSPTRRVLVADDSWDVARRIAELLSEQEDTVVLGPAHDGLQALDLYSAELPDTAVLDFDMPGLSGLDVLRRIRAGGRPCLVIILTAHIEPALREHCLAAGADHFLHKGSALDRLVEILSARN